MDRHGRKAPQNGKKTAQTIKDLFEGLPIEDKVKVLDSLADPIKSRIDKIIRDTYEPGYGRCSGFFIESSCVYWNGPKDYKTEKYMTACSYDQENISFPLRWFDEGYDYKADYRREKDEESARDRERAEREEKAMLRRLKAKYEQNGESAV